MSSTGRAVKSPGGNRTLTQDPRKLRRKRFAAGLTIHQLAKKAGVGAGSISDLENAKQSARVTMLAALASALGCEIEDLMADEPNGNAA